MKVIKKNPTKCVILSIFTLGIYLIYWRRCVIESVNQLKNETSSSTRKAILLSIFWLHQISWWRKTVTSLRIIYENNGLKLDITEKSAISGAGIQNMVRIQKELNKWGQREKNEEKEKRRGNIAYFFVIIFVFAALLSFGGGFAFGLKGILIGSCCSFVFLLLTGIIISRTAKKEEKEDREEIENTETSIGLYKAKRFFEVCCKKQLNPFAEASVTKFVPIARFIKGISLGSLDDAKDMYLLGADPDGVRAIMRLTSDQSKAVAEQNGYSFYSLCVQHNLNPYINNNLRDFKLLGSKSCVEINSIEDARYEYDRSRNNLSEIIEKANNSEEKIRQAELRYKDKILKLRKKEEDLNIDAEELTKVFGKDKYLRATYKERREKEAALASAKKSLKYAQSGAGTGTKDAAIVGGLAAGITGSHVIGAATAYQVEQQNKQAREIRVTETILMQSAVERAEAALAEVNARIKKFLSQHKDYLEDSTYIDDIAFDDWSIVQNESGNITVSCKASLKQDVRILDKPGIIDGSVKISCIVNGSVFAEGFYSAPGIDSSDLSNAGFGSNANQKTTVTALCLSKDGGVMIEEDKISFKISPVHMWAINL